MSLMPYLERIGFYESLIIITVFSFLVIAVDEVIHARARKRREARGGKPTH